MASSYLGFDVACYPGDGVMAWLWTHGLRISGFYLNHQRGHVDASWLGKRALLVRSGWALAPLYLGWQTVTPTGETLPPPPDPTRAAIEDAAEAVGLMRQAGFAPGTTLFCDVEDGTEPAGAYAAYLATLLDRIRRSGFTPAVYCSYRCAAWAARAGVPCWSFHIPGAAPTALDPGNLPRPPIDQGCVGTQFAQNVHLTGLPVAVDLNWFNVADPSSPGSSAVA